MSNLLAILPKEQLDLFVRTKLKGMPEITENQANMMLHAIGADYKRPNRYKGKKYYHATRNYYDAGGLDAGKWADIVTKGYAEKYGNREEKTGFYGVTPNGLELLELLTESTIYDDYDNYADCRDAVLVEFLKQDVYCGFGCWIPTSVATVSRALHIPYDLTREACRNLSAEGYIVKDYYGEMDDEGQVHCYHGYSCTKKARELKKWKELHDAEMECLDKFMNKVAENGT